MSDYSNTFGGAAKDTANSTILGAEIDTELNNIANMSASKANKVAGATSGNLATLSGTGDLVDSGVAATVVAKTNAAETFDEKVTFVKQAVFDATNTSSGGSGTIDWTTGNKHSRTQTANGTLTFTAPGGSCSLVLKVLNSGASRTITWPSSVKWPDSSVPTPSASGKYDIYSFFYDGTNYWGGANLNY